MVHADTQSPGGPHRDAPSLPPPARLRGSPAAPRPAQGPQAARAHGGTHTGTHTGRARAQAARAEMGVISPTHTSPVILSSLNDLACSPFPTPLRKYFFKIEDLKKKKSHLSYLKHLSFMVT